MSATFVRRMSAALAAVALWRAPAAAQQLPPQLHGFDAYVAKAMKEWEVPGVAIAVVKDDSVVLAKGYGVRTLGKPDPVDARTMFAIASATKAFTATLVGMLVDENKVRWDDHVTRHLPGFELFDPYVTRELTVRDLLSHRSGLARGDLLWYASANDDAEVLRRVRYLRPTWSLRSQFGYQNIMYIAAGQLATTVAGKPWTALVRERIFAPLGMTSTNTSTRGFATADNVASPHDRIDDTVRVIAWRNFDNVAAAGAINSNVVDMAKWVRFQLDSGKAGSKRLLTSAVLAEMHTPHTVIRREAPARESYPFTNFSSYGLGWFLDDFRGREAVYHGGNLDGMSSMVALLPSERLGVVILTNMDGTGIRDVLWRKIFDLYLGAPDKDWSADVRAVRRKLEAQAKEVEKKKEASRVTGTRPSLDLARYAGTYADSLYGEVKVAESGGRLVLTYGPAFVGDLEHWHYDTFRARWRDRALGKALVTFALGQDAKVSGVSIENVGRFEREDRADTTAAVQIAEADLAKFLGSYRAAERPLTVSVEKVGRAMKMIVPGQPAYTLVPVTPTRFRLAGGDLPPGFFADFTVSGGAVTRLTFEQPAPQPTLTLTPVRETSAR